MRCQSLALWGGGERKETVVFCHHLWTSDDRCSFVVVKRTSRALSSGMFFPPVWRRRDICKRKKSSTDVMNGRKISYIYLRGE